MTTESLDIQTEEKVHNAIVVTESGPTQVPIKFDVTQAAIAKMYKHARTLTITGPDDKDGFNAVYQYRQMVKQQRVRVQKKQKELKAPHIQYNRDVDAEAKKLTESMDEIEEGLSAKEKTYNDERERIAEEKAKAERVRLEGRIEQIRSSCFKYNAESDTYGFGDVIINMDDIRSLSDEEYGATAELILTTQKAEADRLAEVKRLEDLEKERIANEQKAEQEKIAAENKRLAEERAELQRKADALDKLTLQTRIVALKSVGFVEDGYILNSPSGNEFLKHKSILAFTEEEFDQLLKETEVGNKQREEKRLAAEQDRALKTERTAKLLSAGFVLDSDEGLGVETYIHGYLIIKSINLSSYSEEQFDGILKEAQQITDKIKQDFIDKQNADVERQERLRSDKQLIGEFLRKQVNPDVPALSEVESATFMLQYGDRLQELTEEFTAMLEVL